MPNICQNLVNPEQCVKNRKPALADTGENVQKWTRVFSTRR